MSVNKQKTLFPNYAALEERMGLIKSKPSEEETRSFLEFWESVYLFWLQSHSPFDKRYSEEKAEIRKRFIKTLGIKS